MKIKFTNVDSTTTRRESYRTDDGFFTIKVVDVFDRIRRTRSCRVFLIDYDENVGAIGEFETFTDAILYLDAFVDLAIPAYTAKYAKYGQMPTITFVDGILVMNLAKDG